MTFVRFTRSFEHKDPETGQRTRYPVDWSGEVEAAVEQAASEAGALAVLPAPEPEDSDAPVNPGVTPAPHQPSGDDTPDHAALEAMTKAELEDEAKRRGVDLPSGATKGEMLAALKA